MANLKHGPTAKVPHAYEFYHDEPGFNYRMPNINRTWLRANGKIKIFWTIKGWLLAYIETFSAQATEFIDDGMASPTRLNAVLCRDEQHKQLLDGLIGQDCCTSGSS